MVTSMRAPCKASQYGGRKTPAELSLDTPVPPVAKLVVSSDDRQEPGQAPVGRKGIEPSARKRAFAIQPSGCQLTRSMPQPAHHDNTTAMAAKRMKNARQFRSATFTKMRHAVPKIGDISPPAMRQPHAAKLRKDHHHACMEMPCPGDRIMHQISGPAAEQHAFAIRRRPKIEKQPFGIGDHSVGRKQLGNMCGTKLLRCNLV